MAKARVISGDAATPKVVAIVCLGCNEEHNIFVQPPEEFQSKWAFNGNYERPTFQPSVHIRFTKYENGFANWKPGDKTESVVCHFIVTDGMIQFCGDCTHHLSGQTVELPDIESNQPVNSKGK